MEIDGGEEEKSPPEAWKKAAEGAGETSGGNVNSSNSEKPKRKMKTPYQLEVLEQTYAVDNYPSEALRAELSVKIGLTDRQLQMWFCHRRLKDRKFPPPAKKARKEEEAPALPPPPMPPQPVGPSSEIMMAGSSSASPFSSSGEPRRAGVRPGAVMGMGKRYYEPPPIMAPPPISPMVARAIASVEAQLGEPLREDGPILGMEFDPLPPGAFGAPIAVAPHHKQPMRPYSGKLFERHEPKTVRTSFMPSMEHSYMPSSSSGKRKAAVGGAHVVHPQASSRALHEYQFLPEQPSIRSETYEKLPQSHFYDSVVSPNTRASPLQAGGHYLHGNEPVPPTYTFQGQLSNSNVVPQGRQQIFSPGPAEYNAPHSNSLTNNVTDAQFGMHPVLGSDSAYLPSDRRMLRDEDSSRVEKKRKSEEARIQKEVEAHEKRIRKELEKQDILRRKREEQMRKEMERHDRERRKEEERLLREKQREEERLLREQRRENERREKFLQKETLRAEKMRQKEEQRREKELARLKAANERATARRIAREYLELIEDERLELMELAASNKGLSSIISLDSETLEQLDLFRDMLSLFPPKSVPLKRPFPNLHWTSKEENIGNFLMVWKFLITFADILGLWPFTIDEFLQSLHDYDSKLLGEIHVALLKSIIKDIEDVARTPAIALGANQNSAANPGGGHPQIVEGAYAWGFDIRSWQLHLNLITWPEILRQLAISAGLGPQLKKRNVERPYFRDDNEGNDGEDVISTLRNGAAAENAAALMHERGYSNRRRSRHRLTPGTVKFAAFHVLSLEGSKGLTILEVAERIQKSGLRDLTTSKTPEASIAAALSRDTKLFERTAPSTYCVRTPYRKDPADADTILSAAREKIQVFQNGLSDSEEAEKDADFVEEAERDEDSECDGADDPEIDDASTDAKLTKDVLCSDELKDSRLTTSLRKDKNEALHASGLTQGNSLATAGKSSPALPLRKSNLISLSNPSQLVISSPSCQGISNADVEDTETNEINYAETWVQGLSEGDYSDLSVEERLNALVALIGVATEGNSIRVILEERLEAANTLKKQMWAEAQLDKRRFKEEYMSKIQYSSFMGSKAESSQANTAAEGSQTPPEIIDNKDNGGNPITIGNDQFLYPECQSNFNMSADKNLLGQEYSTNPDSAPLQQHGYAAEKSRSQLKSYIGHKAEQHYVYRSLPLGQDRRRNRYWMFSTTTSPNDPGSGRIFFESKDGFWRLIDTEEAFDALLAALDTRGVRESQLHSMLQRIEPIFKESIRRNRKQSNSDDLFATMGTWADMSSSPDCHAEIDNPTNTLCGLTSASVECSGSFRIGLCRNEREKKTFLKRYKAFLKWMWKECYGPSVLCAMKYGKKRCDELLQACHSCFHCYLAEERHCPSCHKTFKAIHNADAIFSDHFLYCEARQNIDSDWYLVTDSLLPIGLQLLKALLSLMEASIPGEALQPFWTDGYRKSWGVKLHSSTSAEDVLQLVTLLESAVKRDCLSSNYETTNELLGSSTPAVVENNTAISGLIPLLPWVPDSSAAVALRILDLDSSVSYIMHQKLESNKEKEAGYFVKPPSRFTVVKNVQELEPTEYPEQVDYQREMRWPDPGSGRRGRGGRPRGRGGRPRGRGGRGLRGINIYAREFNQENVGNYEKATRKYTRRGGRTRGRGRKRGRRSVRPRQKAEGRDPVAKDPHPHLRSFTNVRVNFKQDSFEESPKSYGGNYWGLEEPTDYAEERRHNEYDDQEDSAGSQSDENGLLSGDDEYDDRAETSNYIMDYDENKPMGMMDEESDDAEDDVDGDDDDDGDEDDDEDERVRIGHGVGQGVGHGVGHRMMDDDDDDDDDEEEEEEEDMGDEDGEDIGPDVNGDDEDDDDYSSEYSD